MASELQDLAPDNVYSVQKRLADIDDMIARARKRAGIQSDTVTPLTTEVEKIPGPTERRPLGAHEYNSTQQNLNNTNTALARAHNLMKQQSAKPQSDTETSNPSHSESDKQRTISAVDPITWLNREQTQPQEQKPSSERALLPIKTLRKWGKLLRETWHNKSKRLLIIGSLSALALGGIGKAGPAGDYTWKLSNIEDKLPNWKHVNGETIEIIGDGLEKLQSAGDWFSTEPIPLPDNEQYRLSHEGILGAITPEAFSHSTTDECMQYINDGLEYIGVSRINTGLYGNAWQYSHNVELAGGEITYSVYNNHALELPINGFDLQTIKTYMERSINQDYESERFSIDDFHHGDLVSLYNPGSPNFKKAFDEGSGKLHTHVGIIIVENGQKYLIHTKGTHRLKEPLDQFLASAPMKVAEIVRPHYAGKLDISEFADYIGEFSDAESIASGPGKQLLIGLKRNRDIFTDVFPITTEENNAILSACVGIYKTESTSGIGSLYLQEQFREDHYLDIMKFTADVLGVNDRSVGMGQVKPELTLGQYAYLFKNMDVHSPEYAAAITPLVMTVNYIKLRDYCTQNGITIARHDLLLLAGCVYNKGWSGYEIDIFERLQQYKQGAFSLSKYKTDFPYVAKLDEFLKNTRFNFYKTTQPTVSGSVIAQQE